MAIDGVNQCTTPGAPAIGTASVTGANQIQVTWADGAPPSTVFNVYRAVGTCASPGTFVPVGTALAGSPFTDSTVSGGTTYAYHVTGVDSTGGCESDASACVQATATGACLLPPAFAGLTSAANQASATCGVSLAWSAATPGCGGSITYNVYRSTTAGFTPGLANLIAGGVTGTSYTDSSATLTNGTAYSYIVRAVDGLSGTEDGNTVTHSTSPTGPIATSTLTETFEGTGFDNPGWTHSALSGATDWAWSIAQSQTPTHSWFSADQTTISHRALVTPEFVPQAGTTLSFWHTFSFEGTVAQCYDAGTLESSTDNGSTWTVVPDANFTAGGFNGTVNGGFSNPLAGKRAWCSGAIGAMTQVTADLASFTGASNMKLRWHEGDDSSATGTGWYVDSVTIANAGVADTCTSSSPPPPVATNYFTVTPCRLKDTRNANGPLGGPVLQPLTSRTFVATGSCGVPATAKAVSANVTVTLPAAAGSLTLFSSDQAMPLADSIYFKSGQTRGNNTILRLATDGSGRVTVANSSGGTVHFILDINGYFE
jgi:hypothetical protein